MPSGPRASSRTVPINATCPASGSATKILYLPFPITVFQCASPISSFTPFSVNLTFLERGTSFGLCAITASKYRSTKCSRQARSHDPDPPCALTPLPTTTARRISSATDVRDFCIWPTFLGEARLYQKQKFQFGLAPTDQMWMIRKKSCRSVGDVQMDIAVISSDSCCSTGKHEQLEHHPHRDDRYPRSQRS